MRSVWITRTGPPEALEVRDGPEPVPGAGEVLIRIHASGVNFADVMARLGLYPDAPPRPCVVGYEVAGTVERTGAGVDGALAPGRRVLALTRFGGYAEAVAVPAAQVFPIPDRMRFEETSPRSSCSGISRTASRSSRAGRRAASGPSSEGRSRSRTPRARTASSRSGGTSERSC